MTGRRGGVRGDRGLLDTDRDAIRVLVISPLYPSAEDPVHGVFVERQVRLLEQLGVAVELVVSTKPARKAVGWKYLRLAFDVLRVCGRPFDLVHVHWPVAPGVYGWLVARLRRRPLVVTIHGAEIDPDPIYDFELGRLKRRLTRAVSAWVLRRSDAVIVVGSYLVPVVRAMGVAEERISVINMGVNTDQFRPHPRQDARDRLGLPGESPVFVSIGSLTPVKGHRFAIEAFGQLVQSHASCRLYVLGEGYLEGELRRMARELGLVDHVVFVGARPSDEVAWWLAASDALIVASLTESFGLVALEALACGVPVIASRVGGLVDQVEDGVNGFLVPPGDPGAIAGAARRILADPGAHEAMGLHCVRASRRHDALTQAARVVGLYRELLCVPGRSAPRAGTAQRRAPSAQAACEPTHDGPRA